MAAPPRIRLSAESSPDAPAWWRERVLPLLTASLTDVRDALDKKLTRRENTFGSEAIGITFTTAAAVADTWPIPIKNNMPDGKRPTHLWMTDLRRTDGAPIADAASVTYDMSSTGQILLTFQGLSNATAYRASVAYE